jgi:hypothetical protein
MTHHRRPFLPAKAAEATEARKDGALGAHRHKIAMTMLGSTVAACAVFGTVLSTGPIALAADTKTAAPAAKAKPKPKPKPPALASGLLLAAAAPALQAAATAPTPTPAPTHTTPAPVVKKTQAPAPKHTSQPVQSNPYAGESAYKVAEGIVPSGEFACFAWIVDRESGWNVEATNPSSGAYGLGQALPGSKMASAGPDWRTDPATQIRWTLSYMDGRYGSPCGAQGFWESHGWY